MTPSNRLQWIFNRAKELITIVQPRANMKAFDNRISICPDGSLEANFSDSLDMWTVDIGEEDLHMSNEEVAQKYKQRIAEEEEKRLLQDKNLKDNIEIEEKALYLELKAKYDNL